MSTRFKKLIMKSMRLPPLSQSKTAKSLPLTVPQRERRKNERGGRKIVKTAPYLNKHNDWVNKQASLLDVKTEWCNVV